MSLKDLTDLFKAVMAHDKLGTPKCTTAELIDENCPDTSPVVLRDEFGNIRFSMPQDVYRDMLASARKVCGKCTYYVGEACSIVTTAKTQDAKFAAFLAEQGTENCPPNTDASICPCYTAY